ncbi:hypothetical protein Taro_024099 [Colocasia esculenta]|uniref:Uncharacterized protein n=1 Tax=Colocasia esculenta TaxID=4460 RepID=A0A843VAB4_COLES|nr:hypothetical protein [Colocasia esculenta]
MVCGAPSRSSYGRSSRGRGLFQASATGPSSVPPPVATGSGEFTPPHPRVPVAGPSSVPSPIAAGICRSFLCVSSCSSRYVYLKLYFHCALILMPLKCYRLGSVYTFSSYSSSVPEDAASLQEGEGSFYDSTLREVGINGDKIEPAQESQFITRTIQAHFLRPIHRFNDFPMEVHESLYQMFMSNHRFTRRSDEARSRLVWTTTARSNFKHLLYNAMKNAEKVCQSADLTLWRERAATWMMRDYWESLCNIWAAERWQQTSTTMKEKDLKRPSTFQEVFDKTHKKKGIDQYISDRAQEVAVSIYKINITLPQ